MTDTPRDSGDTPNTPQDVPIVSARKAFWDSASIVWAIPVVAMAVALGAAWQAYSDQGALIEVSFLDAGGIRAEETTLRYRDITVGTVEDVGFSDDLSHVIVGIRVKKELADYIDADAQFWVVRPEVTAQGVSGLDTVLSGVYLQGFWDDVPRGLEREFEGLDNPPLRDLGRAGVTFTFSSDAGLPGKGTPILYKGVQVGAMGASQVNADGTGVIAEAVVYQPHAGFISTSTRFWDISGFSFSIGAEGARLNFSSLASLISGGVTFDTIGSGGMSVADGAEYELFASENAARNDFLVEGDGQSVELTMIFEENLAGLSAGAAVELGGLRVGEVISLNGFVDEARFGDSNVRLIASVKINPSRIGLGEDAGEAQLFDFLDAGIADGMRARLVNASLLTGGLKVQLAQIPGVADAVLDRDATPFAAMPTAAAQVTDVGTTAQGVLQRVNDLPIEEVMQSITGFLDNASTLIGSDALQNAPAELTGILTAVREVAESDGIQALPVQLGGLLSELQTASAALTRVVAEFEAQDTAGKLTIAIENVGTASASLPDLVTDMRGVLANAQAVPLAELSQSVSDLLASADAVLARADTLVASEDIQAVPAEIRAILASLRDITQSAEVQALPARATELLGGLQDSAATLDRLMTELEEGEAPARLTAALENAGTAAEALPGLVADARGVLASAQAVPFEALSQDIAALVASADALLVRADALVASDDVQALPGDLRAILASVRDLAASDAVQALPAQAGDLLAGLQDSATTLDRLMTELETRDVIGQLTGAIDTVSTAADGLPGLVAQAETILQGAAEVPLEQLAEQASGLLASANALMDQDSTRALPAELNAALASIQTTLTELQDGGLVANANATLASARSAADAIAEASASLPRLAADLRGVATQANATLATYDGGSQFTRDTRGAIRGIEAAASAIERLVRTIERNPNSLLLGR